MHAHHAALEQRAHGVGRQSRPRPQGLLELTRDRPQQRRGLLALRLAHLLAHEGFGRRLPLLARFHFELEPEPVEQRFQVQCLAAHPEQRDRRAGRNQHPIGRARHVQLAFAAAELQVRDHPLAPSAHRRELLAQTRTRRPPAAQVRDVHEHPFHLRVGAKRDTYPPQLGDRAQPARRPACQKPAPKRLWHGDLAGLSGETQLDPSTARAARAARDQP
jgi:hypothetical protein